MKKSVFLLISISGVAFGQMSGIGNGPASIHVLGSNSQGLPIIAATAADVDSLSYVTGGGTAQAQTATYSPAIAALIDGLYVCWKPSAANTTLGPTFAPNGLTAHTIVKIPNATALVANDLITTQVACAIYDLASTQWELQNPATAVGTGTVTSAGTSFTGGLISVAGSPVTTSGTAALTVAGTSGGVPYFSGASTWATSGVMGAGQFMLGGGAGTTPTSANISGDCTSSASAAVTCVQLNGTNFQVSSAGLPTKIDGITTVGTGVPIVGWKSNVTGQSASQTTVTLATSPTAGDYEIHYNSDMSTVCTTGSNSVSFTWNWTDASNARVLTTGSLTLTTAQTTSSYLAGIIPIHVGSGNVTYTSTVVGTCATGTSTYDINAWVARAN